MCCDRFTQNKLNVSNVSVKLYAVICINFIFIAFVQGSQLNKHNACPVSFKLIGRKCYYLSTEKTYWQEAHHSCVSKNSSLSIINSSRQQKYLTDYLKRKRNDRQDFWIGGIFDQRRKIWIWGESAKPVKYENFSSKNRTADYSWHCILLDANNRYSWNARNCFDSKHFLCQKKANITVIKKQKRHFNIKKCKYEYELTPYERRQCLKKVGFVGNNINEAAALTGPTEATVYVHKQKPKISYVCAKSTFMIGRKCYYFSKDEATWQDAHYACVAKDSELAIITNKMHDFKIREFLTDNFVEEGARWIGGVYDHLKKKWRWPNGHPVVYQGFAKVALRNKNLALTSTFMDPKYQYRWNADNVMSSKLYICQSRAKTVVIMNDIPQKLQKPQATITILTNDTSSKNSPLTDRYIYENTG